MDEKRQLERAARLLDIAPRGAWLQTNQRPYKSLEQLFGEGRSRAQPSGAAVSALGSAASPFGPAGVSRLLQGPLAQHLDREVADFSLGPSSVGSATQAGLPALPPPTSDPLGTSARSPSDPPNIGIQEFFALRHERVLLGAVEEAHRDCMRSLERHSFQRIQSDWEATKERVLGMIAPQRINRQAVGSGVDAAVAPNMFGGNPAAPAAAPPPQDSAIVPLLLHGDLIKQVKRISQLSCETCPRFANELGECWKIVARMLEKNARMVTCGALQYLQEKYAEEVTTAVYRSQDARLGGVPDQWSIIQAYGRVKSEIAHFPCTPEHVWYAAFVAARAGFAQLLVELPQRAGPAAGQCPMLRTVCNLLARRLQATSIIGQFRDLAIPADTDAVDLNRGDLAEESNPFHDVLLALLLERQFKMGRLPEGTVEDWLWFRLHALQITAHDTEEGGVFAQHLEALRRQAVALPPSHYEPTAMGPQSLVSGLGALGEPLPGPGVGAATQTLSFVKVLLLTAQFGKAVQQLRAQDRSFHGPALHMALVLHRAGTLEALAGPDVETRLNVTGMVCDYACHFASADQLQYMRVLDPPHRAATLQRLLLSGGLGTSDELLGYIDAHGRHTEGLLEKTLREDGLGGGPEFTDICARAGHVACEHGQYREALRLFHLGRCHSEVLQVMRRCLRLPVWSDPVAAAASEEASFLAQDLHRFYSIYERNLDRYALSSQAWGTTRKLYAARQFHVLCSQGQDGAALDLFQREQLLPLGDEPFGSAEGDNEICAEYPRIIDDYVRILRHAASRGAIPVAGLRSLMQRLQSFLAVNSNRIVLHQDTVSALADLTLC